MVEGFLNTDWIEPEGPFGESHGYMHPRQINPFMDDLSTVQPKCTGYVSYKAGDAYAHIRRISPFDQQSRQKEYDYNHRQSDEK